jgi:4a-hydroxytetrahydrobiopterin dehydratase
MDLTAKKCVPCEGGVQPLEKEKAAEYLKQLGPGWETDGKKITKRYRFKDFAEAMGFVNKVAEVAEAEGHHPDIHIEGWNKVRIVLFTHAIKGLHENDFIVAAKIDGLAR